MISYQGISFLLASENGSSGAVRESASRSLFFGRLTTNHLIITMVVAAVLLYAITRQLYIVLIRREWHPSKAKLLSLSLFFILLACIFTILFVGLLSYLIFVVLWLVVIIFIVMAILRSPKKSKIGGR